MKGTVPKCQQKGKIPWEKCRLITACYQGITQGEDKVKYSNESFCDKVQL